jgi:hypothetical protein
METTDINGWWHCPGCGVDAELDGTTEPSTAQPCPDCNEPMLERSHWVVAA